MEGTSGDFKSEVNSWLQVILKNENLKNLSVNVLGKAEKGAVYIGDVIFVDASGTTETGSTKNYSLVLKCSKRSQTLREHSITKEAFSNEIYIHDTVMPTFTKLQMDEGMDDYFNSFPKCYGIYTEENMEVIAQENLKKLGYVVWEKKNPLPRSHVDKVLQEYGKLHAVSIAVQQQQPETFQKFKDHFRFTADELRRKNDPKPIFHHAIEEVYDLLKDDFEEEALNKWRNLKEDVDFVFGELLEKAEVNVIVHGDGWSNHFMFFYEEADKKVPTKLAILDWHLSKCASPIIDLSYFIFSCISEEDLEDLESVLRKYYESFSQHLKKLGTDPDSVYSFARLLEDWKKYCKFGIMSTSLVFKICSTEKEEVVDVGEAAEKGVDFNDAFKYKIKDTANFKKRMVPIIKYVVKHGLI